MDTSVLCRVQGVQHYSVDETRKIAGNVGLQRGSRTQMHEVICHYKKHVIHRGWM